MSRLPNFLIVGAPRSGTTALALGLSQHPQVFVPMKEKELHFFDSNFEQGLDWYRDQFSGARAEAALAAGEATPTYMYDNEAISRMSDAVPEARLIAILRNPVDRAYSHYWMNRSLGREDLSFEEAIAQEPARLASGDLRAIRRFSYLERGRYAKYLEKLLASFTRDQVLVLFTEDLRGRPADIWHEVGEFLGIDPDFTPLDAGREVNSYATYRSLKLRFAAQRLPEPMTRVIGRLNRRKIQYPPMEPAFREELNDICASGNAALAAWLNRDLPWGY